MHFIPSLIQTMPLSIDQIYFRDDTQLKMGKDRSRLGMRKGKKKKGSFLDNQKRHRAEVKKSRNANRTKKTEGEEGEGDAGPRKAFKFQNFSEQVLHPQIHGCCMMHFQSYILRWLQSTPPLCIS